jgi:hypothetical protein
MIKEIRMGDAKIATAGLKKSIPEIPIKFPVRHSGVCEGLYFDKNSRTINTVFRIV